MKSFTRLKSRFPKAFERKPKFLVDPKEPTEIAWIDNQGIVYHQFSDPFKTPHLRALNAMVYFEELRMRTRKEHLDAETDHLEKWIESGLNSLSGEKGKINLVRTVEAFQEMKKVVVYRKERMSMLPPLDIAYKLASVVFFDETENPYRYDMAYGQKKIERWKRDETIEAFFLRQPLVRLMPFLGEYAQSLATSSQASQKITEFQLADLSTPTYKTASTKEPVGI